VSEHSKFLIRSLSLLFYDYSLYCCAFYYAFSFNESCETVKIMGTIFARSKIKKKKKHGYSGYDSK